MEESLAADRHEDEVPLHVIRHKERAAMIHLELPHLLLRRDGDVPLGGTKGTGVAMPWLPAARWVLTDALNRGSD